MAELPLTCDVTLFRFPVNRAAMRSDGTGSPKRLLEFSRPSRAASAGRGAWQSQTIQRGWELLGRYLGVFTDKVEVGAGQQGYGTAGGRTQTRCRTAAQPW
jgi:hypothetical protein